MAIRLGLRLLKICVLQGRGAAFCRQSGFI